MIRLTVGIILLYLAGSVNNESNVWYMIALGTIGAVAVLTGYYKLNEQGKL